MKLYMYTDAGRNRDMSTAASIVVSDDTFYGIVLNNYEVSTPGEAELQGVRQGLEYIIKSQIKAEKVIVYTDHRSIYEIYRRLRRHKEIKIYEYESIWKEILKLSKKLPIEIRHFRGHQVKHNINKSCDVLSKLVLNS